MEPAEPNVTTPPESSPSIESLTEEVRSLRLTTTIILAVLACVGAALTIYLYRQVTTMNRQVVDGKRFVNDFQSNAAPKISWFINNLQAFAKTNPDFNPILAKYNLLPGAAPMTPARPVTPAPAPAPATPPKK